MYIGTIQRNNRFKEDSARRESVKQFIKAKFYWYKITRIDLGVNYADILVDDEGKTRRIVVFTNSKNYEICEISVDKRYSISAETRSVALVA